MGPRAVLDAKYRSWPLFYRLRGVDLFLAGYLLAGLLLFLFRGRLLLSLQLDRLVMFNSFIVVVLCLNRAAFLLAGRGAVSLRRLNKVLKFLLESGSIDLKEFSCRTRIRLTLLRVEIDRLMAEGFLLGYFDRTELKIVVDDNPLKGGFCPVCGHRFLEVEKGGRICRSCGTAVYV